MYVNPAHLRVTPALSVAALCTLQNDLIVATMRMTWDEAKHHANLAKHGLDFQDACLVLSAVEAETYYAQLEA